MKIYTSRIGILYVFAVFMALLLVSSQVFLANNYLIIRIASFGFFVIFAGLFQLQKYTMLSQLSKKLKLTKQSIGFIYNNGRELDIFENFLILSLNKIVVCTSYLPVSSIINKHLGKESYIKQFELKEDLHIQIYKSKNEILIKSFENIEIIQSLPHLEKLLLFLKNSDYHFEIFE